MEFTRGPASDIWRPIRKPQRVWWSFHAAYLSGLEQLAQVDTERRRQHWLQSPNSQHPARWHYRLYRTGRHSQPGLAASKTRGDRSEEHTSELQSRGQLVCR